MNCGTKGAIKQGAFRTLFFVSLLFRLPPVLAASSMGPEAVIRAEVVAQEAGDRVAFVSLRTTKPGTPENRDDLALFMEQKPDCGLLSNVIRAELQGIQDLPINLVATLTTMGRYRTLYDEVAAYYAAIFYEVRTESNYGYNGVNYRLYVLGLEQGQWVIVEVSLIPIYRVLEAGYGFGTQEEKVALWIQEMALRIGRFLNPKGEGIESERCPSTN